MGKKFQITKKSKGRRIGRRRNWFKKGAPRNNVGYLSVKHKLPTTSLVVGAGVWGNTSTAAPAQPVYSQAFQITGLPNLTSYTKLFDQFRITGVAVKLSNTSNPLATQNDGYNIVSSIDLDGNAIGSVDELSQCSNMVRKRVKEGITIHKIFLRPRIRNIIEGALPPTNSTAFQIGTNKWVDLASPAIPYYGLNYAPTGVPGTTLNNDSHWQVDMTFYVQFRKLR